MLALLSFSAMISSCNSAADNKDSLKEDSLIQVELNQRIDSISDENEKLKAIIDSMKAKDREDSIAAVKKQTNIYVAPVIPVDPGPICEYGVPPVYEFEISPEQIQTKYGVPRN